MAKFEVVQLAELTARIPPELAPLVTEFKGHLGQLGRDQGGRLTLEKGDDPKNIRKALRAAAGAMNKRIRFPFRGEEGSVSFYLLEQARRRGRPSKGEESRSGGRPITPVPKLGTRKRGKPKKAAS